MRIDLQKFGGRGASASNGGTGSQRPFGEELQEFWDEIQDRQYGRGTKMVPEKQQKEYRAAKRELKRAEKDFDGPITLAGGFATDDNYLHTAAKLNAYQRLVRSDVRGINVDLRLGVINESEARSELRTLKDLDRMIERRRKLL